MREYSHKEVDLLACVVIMSYGSYYDAYPSNAVSKKCKHGVKTLVDTIVDQPCQYGNVVIMSQVL